MNADVLLKYFDRINEAPEAVPGLRRFVLDPAVRGKLVEQDPSDEPASALLARISTPAQNRARKQAMMIAVQSPYPAQNPDRKGGDADTAQNPDRKGGDTDTARNPDRKGGDTGRTAPPFRFIFDRAVERESPARATATSGRPAKSRSGTEDGPYELPAIWRWAKLARLEEAEAQASSLRDQLKAILGEALLR